MKQSKAFKKWNNLLDQKATGQPWTEKDIIYFRKTLSDTGLKCDNEKQTLLDKFHDLMPIDGYNITIEQQDKGINYLLNNTYTKTGKLRKNNIFSFDEQEIIAGYSHFTFVGLHPQDNMLSNTLRYLPVYRLHDKHGNFFEYTGVAYSMIEILYTCEMNSAGPCDLRLA